MKRIEGSADGVKWTLFATKDTMNEARRAASKCVLMTKHTYVRIIEVTA
jgi:hypothetical protein